MANSAPCAWMPSWLRLCGAGVEALWMLFAPDSRLLRKLWFDKRFTEEQGCIP